MLTGPDSYMVWWWRWTWMWATSFLFRSARSPSPALPGLGSQRWSQHCVRFRGLSLIPWFLSHSVLWSTLPTLRRTAGTLPIHLSHFRGPAARAPELRRRHLRLLFHPSILLSLFPSDHGLHFYPPQHLHTCMDRCSGPCTRVSRSSFRTCIDCPYICR